MTLELPPFACGSRVGRKGTFEAETLSCWDVQSGEREIEILGAERTRAKYWKRG